MRFNRLSQEHINKVYENPEYRMLQWASTAGSFDLNERNVETVIHMMSKCSLRFLCHLICYSKQQLGIRTAPIFMLAALATRTPKEAKAEVMMQEGQSLLKRLVPVVITRVDEMAELLACVNFLAQHDRKGLGSKKKLAKIPNSIKKGLAHIFESSKFSEFQYSKWDRKGEITLRDVLFMVRPKPQNQEQKVLFAKIANRMLAPAETHERKINEIAASDKKDSEKIEDKVAAWTELLNNKKLSHTALMREMKHILQLGSDSLVNSALDALIATSFKTHVFPYTYLLMFNEILKDTTINPVFKRKASVVMNKLMQTKAQVFLNNFGGSYAILTDYSGSMHSRFNCKSVATRMDVAESFSIPAMQSANCRLSIAFGYNAKVIPKIQANAFEAYRVLVRGLYINSGGTNLTAALSLLKASKVEYESVIVLTDMNFNVGVPELGDIKTFVGDRPVFFINVSADTQTPIEMRGNCYFLPGISDKVLTMLKLLKEGKSPIDAVLAHPVPWAE